jgi:hypothetical protein
VRIARDFKVVCVQDKMVEVKVKRGTFAACSLYRLIDNFKVI